MYVPTFPSVFSIWLSGKPRLPPDEQGPGIENHVDIRANGHRMGSWVLCKILFFVAVTCKLTRKCMRCHTLARKLMQVECEFHAIERVYPTCMRLKASFECTQIHVSPCKSHARYMRVSCNCVDPSNSHASLHASSRKFM